MEPEGLLPSSKEPALCPHTEPDPSKKKKKKKKKKKQWGKNS
jgi:hypothetical protein